MTRKEILHEIHEERHRQIIKEGWTLAHDDEHGNGELGRAAAAYALQNAAKSYSDGVSERLMIAANVAWPFEGQPKLHAPRRALVIAGAFILAEIERLDRLNDQQRGKP